MKRGERKFLPLLLLASFQLAVVAQAQPDSGVEQRPATISGIVTNSRTGEPLNHARVLLDNGAGTEGCQSTICPYGTTSGDGRFSIGPIAPGKYQMIVERRGFGPLADEEENRKGLELKSGDEIKDVVLKLLPDAVISGRVIDEKGTPVEYADVQAEGGSRGFGMTDDRGEFRIGGLRAGRYLVRAERRSLLGIGDQNIPPEIRTDGTTEAHYAPTYYPRSQDPMSATPVEARAGEETVGIEIRLARAPSVHVSGTVSNVPKGAERIMVNLESWHPRRFATVEGPAFKFTFWRVTPGRYRVYAACDDTQYRFVYSPPVEVNISNSSIDGIDLACAPPLELEGRLEIEGGVALPDEKGRALSLRFLSLGSAYEAESGERINPDGSFKLENIARGRYHVIGEGLPENYYVKSARAGTAELTDGILDLRSVNSTSEMTVQLGVNGAAVSGVVRDVKGPVSGARVTLFFDDEYGFDPAATVVAGNDGGYALRGIAPGRYRLVAYDPKSSAVVWSGEDAALHAGVTENIDVREGDQLSRDLKLLR
jgi:hypothetical protein